jgi:hypothetical protein
LLQNIQANGIRFAIEREERIRIISARLSDGDSETPRPAWTRWKRMRALQMPKSPERPHFRSEDMAHGRDKFRSRRNRIGVRDLFWREWDPIGVNQDAHKDEYDRYADKAYVMLMDEGRSAREIGDYLYYNSSVNMGLGESDRLKELASKVAGKLAALKPEFEAASNEPF